MSDDNKRNSRSMNDSRITVFCLSSCNHIITASNSHQPSSNSIHTSVCQYKICYSCCITPANKPSLTDNGWTLQHHQSAVIAPYSSCVTKDEIGQECCSGTLFLATKVPRCCITPANKPSLQHCQTNCAVIAPYSRCDTG